MASGIKITEDVTKAINDVSGRKHGITIFRIDDSSSEDAKIVVDTCFPMPGKGEGEEVIKLLKEKLPPQEPRYCVVDFHFANDEGQPRDKVVFIAWSPDSSNIKKKMIYASSKEAIAGCNNAIQKRIQVADLDELCFKEIRLKCMTK